MKSPLDFYTSTMTAKVTEGPPRFVQVKFGDRPDSKTYTYRVDPEVEVLVGQYAITRRNMSKVTIVAIDTEPVPGLDLSRYDFIDPVAVEDEPE